MVPLQACDLGECRREFNCCLPLTNQSQVIGGYDGPQVHPDVGGGGVLAIPGRCRRPTCMRDVVHRQVGAGVDVFRVKLPGVASDRHQRLPLLTGQPATVPPIGSIALTAVLTAAVRSFCKSRRGEACARKRGDHKHAKESRAKESFCLHLSLLLQELSGSLLRRPSQTEWRSHRAVGSCTRVLDVAGRAWSGLFRPPFLCAGPGSRR